MTLTLTQVYFDNKSIINQTEYPIDSNYLYNESNSA